MQKQFEKTAWEKSDDTYSLLIRVHTTKNHISIYFLPQYQRQRHIDASSVVETLIYHGKLANQIARLATIVVKKFMVFRVTI